VTEADRARADARLFAVDALRAARRAYAETPPGELDRCILSTFVILAAAALFPELNPQAHANPERTA
jgi:hypothetical protein